VITLLYNIKLTCVCNRDGECLLRGTSWSNPNVKKTSGNKIQACGSGYGSVAGPTNTVIIFPNKPKLINRAIVNSPWTSTLVMRECDSKVWQRRVTR
jgi:hypothetical protein